MMPQRQHRASLPFYAYSSFNKKGGRVHAKVAATRNRVLNLWAEMASYSTIAEELDISVTTVVETIARAKRLKDPRAMRSHRDRKVLKADIRRKEIARLAKQGFTAREIAKALKCTKRLVQIRMKEAI
jgi:DNA-binding CsgD family transcriptional regulator